ncbi:hypothetical protein [Erwinia aphidicola]|uniref:hypothetical protein n=1 Tax=Erwinia aphidicola TaxID=68334 RepID=UPI00209CD2B2|nr:hypothetical protein [Erwinia aphidicola]MCP2231833.1 hypothetical protein [Erwinia aphidicola]
MSWGAVVSALFIAIVWGGYFLHFGNGDLSKSTEVWGQFGDYVGGVINPILSFVTIILLINSLKEQRVSNKVIKAESIRQRELEDFKRFETRFFNLIEFQRVGFESFKIDFADKILRSGAAVSYLEELVVEMKNNENSKIDIKNFLDEVDPDDDFHSMLRRFYLILKLIDVKLSGDEKEEYYEVLVNLTESKLLALICILVSYFDWGNAVYVKASSILNRPGLKEYSALIEVVDHQENV